MYSTIVVGTDGSDGAKVAVATAGELAALSGAAVHLVHGYGNPTAMVDPMAGATFVMGHDDVKALEDRLEPQAAELRANGVDVTVLALSCHEPPNARPAEILERHGRELGLLLAGEEVAAAYGVATFPSVVVVAPDGTIAWRRRGGASLEELRAAVDAILGRPAPEQGQTLEEDRGGIAQCGELFLQSSWPCTRRSSYARTRGEQPPSARGAKTSTALRYVVE